MKLIYLGADVPSNRTILETMGIKEVGVSYWRLVKRGLPKNKDYLFTNYFNPFMNIHLYPGIPDNNGLTRAQLEEFVADYEIFVLNNLDRISSFTEIGESELWQLEDVQLQRSAAWKDAEDKFWVTPNEVSDIDNLINDFKNIALPSEMIEAAHGLAAKIRMYARGETRFHAVACAKPDNLRSVPVVTASTMSWLSPMMRGETIVWDGTKLNRYPKRMKDQARPRYRAICEKAGIDFGKVLNDDPVEVCRLALWSYERFEERFNMSNHSELYDNNEELSTTESAENTPAVHDKRGVQERKLIARNESELAFLPVFGVESKTIIDRDEEGREVIKEVPILRSQAASVRVCDTCFVAANCPAFKPQNTCAFSLPVEVKTKEQLKALINAIIEMQGARVAFAKFSEDLNGGYPDPNTSQEIDRLFKLIKTVKELDDSREFIRMTVERQGSGGVLSQIFGDKAQKLTQLPNGGLSEEQTTTIIQQALE